MALRGDPRGGPARRRGRRPTAASTTPSSWSSSPAPAATSASAWRRSPRATRAPSRSSRTPTCWWPRPEAGAEFAVTADVLPRRRLLRGWSSGCARAASTSRSCPGIMPILNLNAMLRQGELIGADGARRRSSPASPPHDDPAAVRAEGIAVVVRAVRGAARRRRAGAALLHAQPVQRHAGDLRAAADLGPDLVRYGHGLGDVGTDCHHHRPGHGPGRQGLPPPCGSLHGTPRSALADALAGAESAREFAVEVCHRHVEPAAVGDVGARGVAAARHARPARPASRPGTGSSIRCADLDIAGALVGELAAAVGDRMVAGRRHPHPERHHRRRARGPRARLTPTPAPAPSTSPCSAGSRSASSSRWSRAAAVSAPGLGAPHRPRRRPRGRPPAR